MPIFRVDGEIHVFAHVPKCAGTTVEAHLAERFGPLGLIGPDIGRGVSLQHLSWDQILAILPASWIASSFAIVRHPLARFVSGYNMRIAQADPPFPREVTLADYLDWVEARLPSVPDLLDNHLRPQVDFLGPDTKVFRLEDGLGAVVDHLDACFGARRDLLPLAHHDHRDPETEPLFDVTEHVPEGVAERVARLYGSDCDRFGYDPLPARPVTLKVLKPGHARPLRRAAWRTRTRIGTAIARRGPPGHG